MKTRNLIFVAAAVLVSAAYTQADQLGPAIICSGAARLDNGSVLTLGQPFAGVMTTPSGDLSINLGILPAIEAATNAPPPPRPKLSEPQMLNGVFEFSFQAQPGLNYIIEASTNLSTWLPIWTNLANDASQSVMDADATNYPFRFYRVETP
jgi:hypothetical protein